MRNHEVTNTQPLLDRSGEIREPGWARSQVWTYRRRDIKAPAFKIKEWDYYLIMGQGFAAAFTISDDGYVGMQSASLLFFGDDPHEHTETVLNLFPMGKLHMPETSRRGDVVYEDKRLQMAFRLKEGQRHITCHFENFWNGQPLDADIVLEQPPMDSMVIASPWDQKHAFYYNQKIGCMRASGTVTYGGKTLKFDPETDYGTLDWGRGVWTYDNTWYWGNGNCTIDGLPFGFNIGYGFGNTSAASENILFYDGKASKLGNIRFNIPNDSGPDPYTLQNYSSYRHTKDSMNRPRYMEPWTFSSDDGRFEMQFQPVLDRSAKIDLKFICTDQHQVFGKMNGTAILDDGKRIEVNDIMVFAEKVHNRY